MKLGCVGVLTAAVLIAGCGGDDTAVPATTSLDISTTTAVDTTLATTTESPAATTTTAPTTTTAAPQPGDTPPDILIAGDQGVILLRGDGTSDTLVTGSVEFALDDSGGGLLFQLQRGRRFSGVQAPTTVWWVPPGTADAAELLVPGDGQHLTLYEARYRGSDLVVWYTRWEGTQPEDLVETLRRYDGATGEVTELASVAGWESGALLSLGGAAIAISWQGEGSCGMSFTDLEANVIEFPAAPAGVIDGAECGLIPDRGELSADGSHFAFVERVRDDGGIVLSTDAVVVDVATGAETARVVGVRPEQSAWWIIDLDLAGSTLVVNRRFLDEDTMHSPLVIDLSGAEPVVMEPPIPGWARIVREPLDLSGRVVAPAP